MALPTRAQAEAFFAELETASRQARGAAAGTTELSPWGDSSMPSASGIVLHYTAGGSFRGSVDWLTRPSWQSKASAHCVIARGREAWADTGVAKGGMVDALTASVVQLRLPSQTAWHSTWLNGSSSAPGSIGIELACIGEVRRDGQGILRGPNDNWTERVLDTQSVFSCGGRLWQGYTAAQIQTAIRVAQYYRALFPIIAREDIVGHEHAQGVRTPERLNCDKRDCGIHFRYFSFRECVMGALETSNFSLQPRQTDDSGVPLQSLVGSLENATQLSPAQLEKEGAVALSSLGYHIVAPSGGARYFSEAMTPNLRSLFMAQRMLGLTADSKLGPKTAAALAWRLTDRWAPS